MEYSEHSSGSQEFLSTSSPGRQFGHQQGQEWGVRIKVLIPKITAIVEVVGWGGWGFIISVQCFSKYGPRPACLSCWELVEMHIPPEPPNQKFWGRGQVMRKARCHLSRTKTTLLVCLPSCMFQKLTLQSAFKKSWLDCLLTMALDKLLNLHIHIWKMGKIPLSLIFIT